MPKSQMERLWIIGAALGAFILVVVGYLVMISPQRDNTSQVNAQVATANEQNDSLAARISALSAQNKNLSTYEKAVRQADAALPAASGMPDFLRSLQAIGNATLTTVASLTVGDPSAWTPPAAAAPATTATPAVAPSTTAAPTQPGVTAPAAPAIYVLAVTAQVEGTDAHLSEFLRQLQEVQPRAVLITQINESNTTGTGGAASAAPSGLTNLQLTMSVFVAPSDGAAPSPGTP